MRRWIASLLAVPFLSALTASAQVSLNVGSNLISPPTSYKCGGTAQQYSLSCDNVPLYDSSGNLLGKMHIVDDFSGNQTTNVITWEGGIDDGPTGNITLNGCLQWATFTSGPHSASECITFYAYFYLGTPPHDSNLVTLHFTYIYSGGWIRKLDMSAGGGAITFEEANGELFDPEIPEGENYCMRPFPISNGFGAFGLAQYCNHNGSAYTLYADWVWR